MVGARVVGQRLTYLLSKIRGGPVRSRTIRQLLLIFATAIMAPLLMLLGAMAYNYAEAQRTIIRTEQRDIASNLAFLLEREIEGVKGALQALATSPEIKSGRLEDARGHLQSASTIRNLNSIAILDESGQVLLSTASPRGQSLPKRDDMQQFRGVFAGETMVSGYLTGAVTGQPIIVISVPVKINERVAYALAAGVKLEFLNSVFAEAAIKPDWLAVIVDRQGTLLARNLEGERYVGQSARQVVIDAITGQTAGTVIGQTREGVPVSNRFVRSAASGWTALIAVPTQILDEPLRKAIGSLSLVIAAVIGMTVVASTALARWIANPISQLKTSAIDVMEGRAPVTRRNTIAELEEVENVFRYTASISADRKKLQDKLQQAVDVASIGIFERDHATDLFELSPSLVQMLGLDTGGTTVPIGNLRSVIAKEDLPAVNDRARQALEDPASSGLFISENRIEHATKGLRWISVRAITQFEGSGPTRRPVKTIGAVRDITERKQIEEDLRLLTRELAHRSKNMLAIVQAMAGQTARSVGAGPEFQKVFGQRIMSLSASIDVLISHEWTGALLADLVKRQLQPFVTPSDPRLIMDKSEVLVGPQAVQALGLAFHELATNAVKYGALSVPTGKVEITWTFASNEAGEPGLRLIWRESGGPSVTPPEHKGFGNVIMDRMVAKAIGGKVDMDFAAEGLVWTLWMPSRHASPAAPMTLRS